MRSMQKRCYSFPRVPSLHRTVSLQRAAAAPPSHNRRRPRGWRPGGPGRILGPECGPNRTSFHRGTQNPATVAAGQRSSVAPSCASGRSVRRGATTAVPAPTRSGGCRPDSAAHWDQKDSHCTPFGNRLGVRCRSNPHLGHFCAPASRRCTTGRCGAFPCRCCCVPPPCWRDAGDFRGTLGDANGPKTTVWVTGCGRGVPTGGQPGSSQGLAAGLQWPEAPKPEGRPLSLNAAEL